MARILRVDVWLSDSPANLSGNEMLITQLLDDYNSWQESWWGRWKRHHLNKDVILAEGISPFSRIIYYILIQRNLSFRLQRIQHAPAHLKLDG